MVFTGYILISAHITFYVVVFTVRLTLNTVHITLHAVVFTVYILISAHITFYVVVFTETYIEYSPYYTPCRGLHRIYINISPYHVLCRGFHFETYIEYGPYYTPCRGFHRIYINISPYHVLCRGFHCETYIEYNPYYTLCRGFHHCIWPCFSHRLTAYKIVGHWTVINKTSGRIIGSKKFFLGSVAFQLHARMLSSEVAQSLKSYGHFSDLVVEIAHRYVGFFR